ncbi:hypothetical protein [Bathymodiolus japonicus methanotrophic gill symbiont]|uniref:hypothetical protein n=1 Tax=Bathymodiolus japonicus methanotrophic gill symbiont TaxID=113269 RepID=UPI001C8EB25A|nr:hypothetical protein [Bathymodiolus japonicus methanotrophic gill symbiont]
MGDALNALRPQRLRTKAASSLLPHWLDGYSECNSCSSRVLLAHVESANCPQARHATSRNSGTPVAVIRSPTQRIGDAPAALRPPQTEHKAAQSWLPQMALRLFGIKF